MTFSTSVCLAVCSLVAVDAQQTCAIGKYWSNTLEMCVDLQEGGYSCSDATECISGRCFVDQHIANDVAWGSLTCDGSLDIGTACVSSFVGLDDCKGNSWCHQTTSVCSSLISSGGSCLFSNQAYNDACVSGYYCDYCSTCAVGSQGPGTCKALKAENAACTRSEECASQRCDQSVCGISGSAILGNMAAGIGAFLIAMIVIPIVVVILIICCIVYCCCILPKQRQAQVHATNNAAPVQAVAVAQPVAMAVPVNTSQ